MASVSPLPRLVSGGVLLRSLFLRIVLFPVLKFQHCAPGFASWDCNTNFLAWSVSHVPITRSSLRVNGVCI